MGFRGIRGVSLSQVARKPTAKGSLAHTGNARGRSKKKRHTKTEILKRERGERVGEIIHHKQ